MAAWFAFLKSRLLLPPDPVADGPSGEEFAAHLAFQLERLSAMRDCAAKLMARDQMGRNFFVRGLSEEVTRVRRITYSATLLDVMQAYARIRTKDDFRPFIFDRDAVMTMEQALEHMRLIIGYSGDWAELSHYIPQEWKESPLSLSDLAGRMPHGCDPAQALLHVQKRYEGRGVHLVKIDDAWAFRTASDLEFLMQKEVIETRKLSRAGIETLAIISYHQPVTRAEIEEIRGVSVSRGTIDVLIELGWVRLGRRRLSPGRPATFVVSREFLDHFGLQSTCDLPGLNELRAAGLLDSRPLPQREHEEEAERLRDEQNQDDFFT